MKPFVLSLVVSISAFCLARDTNRYSRVEARQGFEFSQRGGLGPSNEVVTSVFLPAVASNLAEGASFVPFSNAVARVTPPPELTSETDPHVSSWARKTGGADAPMPDARDLTYKAEFFRDVGTNRWPSVSAAFKGAVDAKVTHQLVTEAYDSASKSSKVTGSGNFVSAYFPSDTAMSAPGRTGGSSVSLTYRPGFSSMPYQFVLSDKPGFGSLDLTAVFVEWVDAYGNRTAPALGKHRRISLQIYGSSATDWVTTGWLVDPADASSYSFTVDAGHGDLLDEYPVGTELTVSVTNGGFRTQRLYRAGDDILSGSDSYVIRSFTNGSERAAFESAVRRISPPSSSSGDRIVDGTWTIRGNGDVLRMEVTSVWHPPVVKVKADTSSSWYDDEDSLHPSLAQFDHTSLVSPSSDWELVGEGGPRFPGNWYTFRAATSAMGYYVYFGFSTEEPYRSGGGSYLYYRVKAGYGTSSSVPTDTFSTESAYLTPATFTTWTAENGMYVGSTPAIPVSCDATLWQMSCSDEEYENPLTSPSYSGVMVKVSATSQGYYTYETNYVNVGKVMVNTGSELSMMDRAAFFDNIRTNAVPGSTESFSNAVRAVADRSAYLDKIADAGHAVGSDGAAYAVVDYAVTNRTYRFDSWSCTATNQLTATQKAALDGAVGEVMYRTSAAYANYVRKEGDTRPISYLRKQSASSAWRVNFDVTGGSAISATTDTSTPEGSDLTLVNHSSKRDVTYRLKYSEEIVPKVRYEKVGDYALKSYVDGRPTTIPEDGSSAKWTLSVTTDGKIIATKEE